MAELILDANYGPFIKEGGICYQYTEATVDTATSPLDKVGPPDEQGYSDCNDCVFEPPVFFGDFSPTYEEGGANFAFNASATDTDTFSIVVGDDAEFFDITGGAITGNVDWDGLFDPDFDNPEDINFDNSSIGL